MKNWRVPVLGLVCFLLVLVALMVTGAQPFEALKELITGAVGSGVGWRNTLRSFTPLLLLGTGVYIALRAGLFNIGADGQYVIGAMCTAWVALSFQGALGIILGILAGTIAGALWALPAGLIKAYRNGHEVITTIMLNNIAGFFAAAMVTGPLKNPDSQALTTKILDESTHLPKYDPPGRFEVSFAILLALGIALAVGFWLKRTVSGYELEATGGNPKAAEFAGVKVKNVIVRSMLMSGGISGLAGAIQVLAVDHRFYKDFSSGIGFDALGVALLAGGHPLGLLASSLVFGIVNTGTTGISLLGVPKGLGQILLACLIVTYAAVKYRKGALSE